MTDPELKVSYTYDPFAVPRYVQAVSLSPGVVVMVQADTDDALRLAVAAMMSGRPPVTLAGDHDAPLLQRYDVREDRDGEVWDDAEDDGDYVRYDDLAALFDRILGRMP